MKKNTENKTELFKSVPVPKALMTMALPTIIGQLINVIYNMVDAFFIGRTGNSYMMAATTVTLTLFLLNLALAGLFGVGGGSLVARLSGKGELQEAKRTSAFSLYGAICVGLLYSCMVGVFLDPLLRLLGASDATMDYARSYGLIVVVLGSLPSVMSMTLGHLLRNAGYATQASIGMSGGGILNVILDPLFMFVLLPPGSEVTGAAIATTLSNTASCAYLLYAYCKASGEAPLSAKLRDAKSISKDSVKAVFAVGIPSAVLTGLFDLANIVLNKLTSAHNDLVLAGMGIVMKLERVPNAINIGICQGMLPIVAFNYASGNHERMRKTIKTARLCGLLISVVCIAAFELLAVPASKLFLSTNTRDAETALKTIAYAALFLRIRCLASPVQFLNYHTSFCMQAIGDGRRTLLHAFAREILLYIPCMFLLDRLLGEIGLAAALPVGEGLGAILAILLLRRALRQNELT